MRRSHPSPVLDTPICWGCFHHYCFSDTHCPTWLIASIVNDCPPTFTLLLHQSLLLPISASLLVKVKWLFITSQLALFESKFYCENPRLLFVHNVSNFHFHTYLNSPLLQLDQIAPTSGVAGTSGSPSIHLGSGTTDCSGLARAALPRSVEMKRLLKQRPCSHSFAMIVGAGWSDRCVWDVDQVRNWT